MKRIFKYLKNIKYDSSLDNVKCLLVCVDANYGQNLNKKKSIHEHVFTLDDGCISWRITLQKSVIQFTTEAKYVTTTKITKKTFCMYLLLRCDCNMKLSNCVTSCCKSSDVLHSEIHQHHVSPYQWYNFLQEDLTSQDWR